MTYRELIITVDTKDLQTASDIMDMLGLGGLYIEDYTDLMEDETVKQVGLVDEELLNKDKTKALIHLYIDEHNSIEDCLAFISERFTFNNIAYTYEQKSVDEEDYANSWKKYYKPVHIGEKIVVVPQWEEYEKKENETVLIMNPGMAFGTGTHETTYMCAEALQETVEKDDEILDVGCGSGILSVTALLCGAKHADATDIDMNAVKVAQENAKMNKVDKKLNAFKGDVTDKNGDAAKLIKDKKYDIVVANIVADVIIKLTPCVNDYLIDDGCYIMSGIIAERLHDVTVALKENNFVIKEIREKKGWNCIIAGKNK